MKSEELSLLAINTAIKAGLEIMKIYSSDDFGIVSKKDESPLTKADTAANSIILDELKVADIPFITEEIKAFDYNERKGWERCWIIDPLDGTKEFIKRNGEFTVNIALIENQKPYLGVIYVPVTSELYFGNVNDQFFVKVNGDELFNSFNDFKSKANSLETISDESTVKIVGSKSHMNEDTRDFIKNVELKHPEKSIEVVSKGSSLKFCMIASGQANIYPRFAPTMEWDTAAGQAICEAAGYQVIDQSTNEPMKYNRENLLNSYFLVK